MPSFDYLVTVHIERGIVWGCSFISLIVWHNKETPSQGEIKGMSVSCERIQSLVNVWMLCCAANNLEMSCVSAGAGKSGAVNELMCQELPAPPGQDRSWMSTDKSRAPAVWSKAVWVRWEEEWAMSVLLSLWHSQGTQRNFSCINFYRVINLNRVMHPWKCCN